MAEAIPAYNTHTAKQFGTLGRMTNYIAERLALAVSWGLSGSSNIYDNFSPHRLLWFVIVRPGPGPVLESSGKGAL
jgi:hypothetical protein